MQDLSGSQLVLTSAQSLWKTWASNSGPYVYMPLVLPTQPYKHYTGKSPITPTNPRGYSISQKKMYNFITSEIESGETNIDYGNENIKTLKMGSFRDTLKRPRDSNINCINDEFNNERTPTFSAPVRQKDESQNINVNIENLNHIDIGITPQVMLTSHSSTDVISHYKLQDSIDVIRRLESPLVGFKNVSQSAYDYKHKEFLHPSLHHFINAYHIENKLP